MLVDPEVEAVALALVVCSEGALEPHAHARVVQLDHLVGEIQGRYRCSSSTWRVRG